MSTTALTETEARRAKQRALSPLMHQPDCPEKFRASAAWMYLQSEESMMPETWESHAAAQLALADDMEANPGSYFGKPADRTYWQWYVERQRDRGGKGHG